MNLNFWINHCLVKSQKIKLKKLKNFKMKIFKIKAKDISLLRNLFSKIKITRHSILIIKCYYKIETFKYI